MRRLFQSPIRSRFAFCSPASSSLSFRCVPPRPTSSISMTMGRRPKKILLPLHKRMRRHSLQPLSLRIPLVLGPWSSLSKARRTCPCPSEVWARRRSHRHRRHASYVRFVRVSRLLAQQRRFLVPAVFSGTTAFKTHSKVRA